MTPIQEVFFSLAVAIPTAGVWLIILTGRLPQGEPENEAEERLMRLIFGVGGLLMGAFLLWSSSARSRVWSGHCWPSAAHASWQRPLFLP